MAFGSTTQAFQGGTGGLVVNKPSGVASGDLIILGMTGYQVTFTLPSGFVLGDDRSIGGPDGQSLMWAYKVAGGSEPSSYTVTINSGFEPTAFLASVSGRDTTSPITAQSYTSNTSSNSSPITLSLTGVAAATGDDVFIIYAGDTTGAADRWSGAPPASYTERIDYDPQDWSGIYAHTRDNVSSGSTGTLQPTLTRTVGSGGAGWLGFVIALKAAAGGSPTVFDLNAATFSYSAKVSQNTQTAALNTKAWASFSAKALQATARIVTNLKTMTSWSAKAVQNLQTNTLTSPVFAWSAKAINFVAGAFVFDLNAASFGFSAKTVQNVQQATHNARTWASFSAKAVQNRLTNTLSLPQIRLTAQALSARLVVALDLNTWTSWSPKALQNRLTVALSAPQFLFMRQAVTFITDAVVSTSRKVRSRYSRYRKLLKIRRY